MNNYIKSPINYTGNKYRLLPQFEKFLPKSCDVFVDLFCGGATIGVNMNAKHIIMVDNNARVISLLKHLAYQDINTLISDINELIHEYNLTNSWKNGCHYYRSQRKGNNGLKEANKDGFYRLRNDYNRLEDKDSPHANNMLYVLMAYGFNNDLRFNNNGEYNLPVGKTDFNKNNYNKLVAYNKTAGQKNISFICQDYADKEVLSYLRRADFVYIDPPYLITTAVYNEGGNWNDHKESQLISVMESLAQKNTKFALSNVLTKVGVENSLLKKWLTRHPEIKINPMDYHYRSCSYNKKDRNAQEQEVLITNF